MLFNRINININVLLNINIRMHIWICQGKTRSLKGTLIHWGHHYPKSSNMCKRGHLKPLDPTPYPDPLPKNWNTNLYCLFHKKIGHSTNECTRLKHEIQDLIDNDVIPKPRFTNQPNVHQNLLPNYQRTPPPNQINFIEVLQEDWVLAIDDEAWDDLEGDKKAYNISWYVEDIIEIEEAHHLTRRGRHFKPAYLEED